MNSSISSIREEYLLASLNENEMETNPIHQFEKWFQEAINSKIDDVNAMTLSTVDAKQKPHSRIVLLKGIDLQQFVFYTNYKSHKGQDMEQNQNVALLFHWKELQRQVRIEGSVSKISEQASTDYFHSRPIESQLGAWASFQSELLENRADLEKRFEALKNEYENKPIPKPPHWGGYAVMPTTIEFWQGRASRLHDRIIYNQKNDNTWQMLRLNP